MALATYGTFLWFTRIQLDTVEYEQWEENLRPHMDIRPDLSM